jgi:aspartate aminotransferase
VISEYRERRDTLVTELNKIEGVVIKPKVRLLYAQLPKETLMILQWLLETYDLNGETVMVAPAAGFTLLLEWV